MEEQTIDATLAETYAKMRGSFEPDFAPPDGNSEPDEPEVPEAPETQPEAPADAPAEAPEQASEGEEPAEKPAEPEQPVAFKPPWKKAALAEWEKLPEMARKEIERRENDFHKGIEQYKDRANSAQEWERELMPFMATIQSYGVTPIQAAKELFKADHLLRYSATPQKVQMLLKVANDYGVDINTLASGIQQIAGEKVWEQQNPADPRVQALERELVELRQQQQQVQHATQSAEASQIDAAIAAFAADPDHEHFSLLSKPMGVLLSTGQAKNLDEAYEMALRQHPQTYQIWLAQQQQKWDEERKAQVQKAKKAGANNVRPNGRASVPSANPARTMEEDIEATARTLGLIN